MAELTDKEKQAIERCEYACKKLKENNIPFEIKKREIGHINLLYNNKPIMSFWARTGRFIFLKNPRGPIVTQDDRGLKNCIEAYLECVRLEQSES